jgi:predicted RNase H-like HicB family nuclease
LAKGQVVKTKRRFTVVIEQDEAGYNVATVPALRGCHTQAKTLDTLMRRVCDVIQLCLAEDDSFGGTLELAGIQQISV